MNLDKFATVRTLATQTFQSAWEDNIPLHGAAIAFYTIFSVAPLLLIILATAEFLLSEELVRNQFFEASTRLWGEQITVTLTQLVEGYSRLPTSLLTHVIAIGALIFGATTVVSQLRVSLNTIWNVPASVSSGIYHYFIDRGISLLIILLIATLFIGSILMEIILPFFQDLLNFILPFGIDYLLNVGLPVSSLLLSGVLFAILFKYLPDRDVPWKPILVGAALTTFFFYAGKSIISFYLNSSSIQLAYRAAGSFIIFLLWIYYNVQIMLLGAVFTKIYARYLKKME